MYTIKFKDGSTKTFETLVKANLSYADLSGADLADACLVGANLFEANLRGANLEDADLEDANLDKADLRDANLNGARLHRASMDNADLEGACLAYANLYYTSLFRADLTNADLSGIKLLDVNLKGAKLLYADLTGATIYDTNLTSAYSPSEMPILEADLGLEVPAVPDLKEKIRDIVNSDENALYMGSWHTCDTTHCLAGWAIKLAGENGKALEALVGSERAGAMIFFRSMGQIPYFFAADEDAMEWLNS